MKSICRKIPLILWSGVIVFGSSQASVSVTQARDLDVFIHKLAHIIEYSILYIFFVYAYYSRASRFPLVSIIGLCFVFLFGLSDEIHQSFTPTRSPRISDAFVDFCGGVAGYIIVKLYFVYTKKTE